MDEARRHRRDALLALLLIVALGAAAGAWGGLLYDRLILRTVHETVNVRSIGPIHRARQVHRLRGVSHGWTEEWYASGGLMSRTWYAKGVRIETAHWSPEGTLDAWRIPEGGVETESWEFVRASGRVMELPVQVRSDQSGAILERRIADREIAAEDPSRYRFGSFSPEEIIAIVAACVPAESDGRLRPPPPLRAPREGFLPRLPDDR